MYSGDRNRGYSADHPWGRSAERAEVAGTLPLAKKAEALPEVRWVNRGSPEELVLLSGRDPDLIFSWIVVHEKLELDRTTAEVGGDHGDS